MKGWLDEVLPRVAKPARYMGGELNSVRKPPEEVSARIALAFPDVYEVGMSNLGLRILYHILNSQTGIAAERAFAPAADMAEGMRRASVHLFSLESSLPIRDFNLVGFSLAYEMTYTTVLDMLDLAGIPIFSRDRSDCVPIVIAGGHCAANPEPMSDFIDAFAIGDGEEVVLDIVGAVEANRGDRSRSLDALAAIEGVYVPSVHGRMAPKPVVRARIVADLENAPFPDRLVVPFTEAVHDRVMVEIMRGCSRGCRFCQAGMITRPVRERSLKTLIEQAGVLLDNTGYEEIALTSLSSADYSHITELVRALIGAHGEHGVGISLPSLRADAECVHLAAEIQKVRKSGLTFAPEAGTQRLRDVINKNVTEDDLLGAVEAAVDAGWRRLKLYFMIGLPTETDEDLRGIADLVRKVVDVGTSKIVRDLKSRTRLQSLNITISPFVPKPHTPFQRRAMDSPEELQRKISLLRPMLSGKNIALSWHDPACSRVEAALARGDSRLGAVIHAAWKSGARLEQDSFDYDLWLAAFASAGLDIADFANRSIPSDAALPWEHIDVGVSSEFLAREDDRASRAETTPDCRTNTCANCGIREHLNRVAGSQLTCSHEAANTPSPPDRAGEGWGEGETSPKSQIPNPRRVLFTFMKKPEARWLGHLDLMRVFERALRMSSIKIAYSQGFNPRPKMSIASALPLGATGGAELLTLQLTELGDLTEIVRALNSRLPEGVSITSAQLLPEGAKAPAIAASEFVLEIKLPENAGVMELESAVKGVLGRESIIVERGIGKDRKRFDLRPGIESLAVTAGHDSNTALVVAILPHRHFTVKPAELATLLAEALPGACCISTHRMRLITQNL